jgi:hypothetical protein
MRRLYHHDCARTRAVLLFQGTNGTYTWKHDRRWSSLKQPVAWTPVVGHTDFSRTTQKGKGRHSHVADVGMMACPSTRSFHFNGNVAYHSRHVPSCTLDSHPSLHNIFTSQIYYERKQATTVNPVKWQGFSFFMSPYQSALQSPRMILLPSNHFRCMSVNISSPRSVSKSSDVDMMLIRSSVAYCQPLSSLSSSYSSFSSSSFPSPPDNTQKTTKSFATQISTTQVPTPSIPSSDQSSFLHRIMKSSPGMIVRYTAEAIYNTSRTVLVFTLWTIPKSIIYYIRHPAERKARMASLKQSARDEIHHYWVGTKVNYIKSGGRNVT